ncbi:MAG: TonB-dependent receptor plug [Caulobacteraceae bacterium]|nr:TonB-dependent receptor plug [Caulobacteraceae bacterium]
MPRVTLYSRRLRGSLAPALAAAVVLAAPATVWAQSVDYQQLGELFGEPVTTSVTGKPQRASEAPAALIIITREDIRRSPANDIVGLLQGYAGIDVARWTATQSDVSLRGGAQPYNARLLVLVNGQQVYLDRYGLTNWAGLGVQLQDIQQIEVVKGPNSALFGFNATSGVINIITINPLQTQQLTMTAEAGDHGYGDLSASGAVKLGDKAGLRLSAGYGQTDELQSLASSSIAPATASDFSGSRHAEAAAELYGRLDDRTEVAVSAAGAANRQTEWTNVLASSQVRESFTSLGARVSHDAGWGVLSGRVYQNRSDGRSPPVSGAPGEGQKAHNQVLVASAAALVRVGGANTLRGGVEYRDNQLKSSSGYSGPTRYHVYAINGMWESAVTDRITLTLAGRLDQLKLRQEGVVDQPSLFTKQDFDRTLNVWSMNSAIVFKVDDYSALRIDAARGVQAPSLSTLGQRLVVPLPGLSFPYVISGDPSVKPSTIWSGEVGYSRTLNDHGGRLELTAFYNKTRDIIASPSGPTPPRLAPPAYPFILIAPENVGSFEAFGLEASLAGRLGKTISWSADYTWTKAQQHIKGEIGDHFDWPIALDRTTPEHLFKAQASYEQGPWLGTVSARYTSKIQQLVYVTGPFTLTDIDASVALDAKLAYRVTPKLTFEIAGENLTGAAGADLSPAAAETRLRAGIRAQF